MKSNKPLFPVLAGYIFNLLVFRIWYHETDTPIMEVVVVVAVITVIYLILYFLILSVSALQRPWKSFLLVSIITLATPFLIQTFYHEKYRLGRAEEIKLTETIRLIKENRIKNLETKIVAANKTITMLKEMLISKQNENDELKKQFKKIFSKMKSIEEEQETKRDFVIQKISNKDFSKINSEAVNDDSDTKKQEIIFKVQILSSSTRLQKTSQQFRGFKNIWEYIENGLYKYTVGNHKDLKSASALQLELRSKGFNGAFVVSFNNGKRIPVREAQRLLN
jgi:uncharacterized coiled-coil protein SlyX